MTLSTWLLDGAALLPFMGGLLRAVASQPGTGGGTAGVSSFNTRTGAVTLLGTDVTAAGGALLASPVFSGVPAAPTAGPGTNTTQLATTAFVQAALPLVPGASAALPLMDAVAVVGTGTTWARADHVHPSDATRLPLTGGTLTGPLVLAGNAAANLNPVPLQQLNSTVAGYLPLAGGTLTGPLVLAGNGGAPLNPVAFQQLAAYAPLASPVFSGDPQAPTAAVGDADNSVATTAFVQAAVRPALNDVGRNLLHNPLFNIAQRGGGPWTAAGAMTADRWRLLLNLDTLSVTVTTLPDAFRSAIGDEAAQYALTGVVTGNAGAASYSIFQHNVESVRRLGGKTVTVSFWAWCASGTPKLGVSIDQWFGTGGSPSAPVQGAGQAVTISATPARYSLTFTMPSTSGKTLGTNGDDDTSLLVWMSSGTANAARAGNIGVQSGTISLWGVQLEIGSVATPLEKPDPQQDLAKCQRFYTVGNFSLYIGASGAFIYGAFQSFPVEMRATATVGVYFATQTNCTGGLSNQTSVGFQPQLTATAAGQCYLIGSFNASADL